jgi:hypothetical protein
MEKREKVELFIDFIHRFAFHHVLWFLEVSRQQGEKKALKCLDEVYKKSSFILIERLSKVLNFELIEGLPSQLLKLEEEKLNDLLKATSISWLANDGIWFQSVEFKRNMIDAKRCNDSCWAQFSPIEAYFIKRFLNLEDNCGLKGLEEALKFRLYAFINKQTIKWSDNTLILEMNDCRVQNARKKKQLEEYPCKSGGWAEFSRFAESIDSSIKTEIIACPPDSHSDEFFCAWRFFI